MADLWASVAELDAVTQERLADVLETRGACGQVGPDLAVALKQEARRRVEAGRFFAHIAYRSLVAQKPA